MSILTSAFSTRRNTCLNSVAFSWIEIAIKPSIRSATCRCAAEGKPSTVGTIRSAMAANTRAREVMLPLLFFPVALPVILAAVEASGVLLGDAGLGETARWLSLLAAFDAIFLVACPSAFQVVVED